MPSYKLSYFNGKGRAELSRLVLTAAGEQFQDNRLEGAGWGALKPSTPWGLLPVLEVDGKFLGQSNTIARYLARKHGLAGGDDWEQAHVESALDATDDMIAGKSKIMQAEESRKPVEAKKLKEEILPKYLAAFEKYIAENGKNGHVVGSKLTLADLALFNSKLLHYKTVEAQTLRYRSSNFDESVVKY